MSSQAFSASANVLKGSDGRPVEIDGAPRSYKAGLPVKSGASPTLIADYKRVAVLTRAPNLWLLRRGGNAAEVQGHSTIQQALNGQEFDLGRPTL